MERLPATVLASIGYLDKELAIECAVRHVQIFNTRPFKRNSLVNFEGWAHSSMYGVATHGLILKQGSCLQDI
jgi:hypothetical protein